MAAFSPDEPEVNDVASEDETFALAARLAPELSMGSVLALVGDLGAGKTAFVRGLAAALGLAPGERVSSPSYALVNEYLLAPVPGRAVEVLAHLDLYRTADPDELVALGYSDLVADAIVVVEWPERAPDVLADATHVLEFTVTGETSRRIRITRPPRR
jgi:tRNA threonylcarbamoyl adenosine modification protein YjeE